MLRYRMNKIIKLLEIDDFQALCRLYESSEKYRRAFFALARQDIIDFVYVEGENRITSCCLNIGNAAVYSLSRHDVWINRLIGFIAGVLTTFIVPLIIQALTGAA